MKNGRKECGTNASRTSKGWKIKEKMDEMEELVLGTLDTLFKDSYTYLSKYRSPCFIGAIGTIFRGDQI